MILLFQSLHGANALTTQRWLPPKPKAGFYPLAYGKKRL
jgi:hypothetical protein